MNWRVLWQNDAAERLASMWLGSRLQSQITEAANSLDRRLRSDPLSVGESREENLRIAIEFPLVIVFEVDESAHTVLVVDVWTA